MRCGHINWSSIELWLNKLGWLNQIRLVLIIGAIGWGILANYCHRCSTALKSGLSADPGSRLTSSCWLSIFNRLRYTLPERDVFWCEHSARIWVSTPVNAHLNFIYGTGNQTLCAFILNIIIKKFLLFNYGRKFTETNQAPNRAWLVQGELLNKNVKLFTFLFVKSMPTVK